jgi:hypothetical protein
MYLTAACLLALQAIGMDLPLSDGGAPSPQRSGGEDAVVVRPALLKQFVETPVHQPAWLSGDAVRRAVDEAAATPLATPASTWPVHAFGAANPYWKFDREFDSARIPDCLHADALKFQPPVIGFVAITDEFIVPFLLVAKLRGKCN